MRWARGRRYATTRRWCCRPSGRPPPRSPSRRVPRRCPRELPREAPPGRRGPTRSSDVRASGLSWSRKSTESDHVAVGESLDAPRRQTASMTLAVEIDPAEAGFDAEPLNRIDRHYTRYVDDGRLAGFLALIARDGKVVHVARGGLRDVEAAAPVEADTLWRIYSMTKPITSV